MFVLPSLLEALPTVAVEALACGTPVVSADHPGGVELHGLFGDDVAVVPREDSGRLAAALCDRLADAAADAGVHARASSSGTFGRRRCARNTSRSTPRWRRRSASGWRGAADDRAAR